MFFQTPRSKFLLSCFSLTSVLEEKQKSDAEEDGGMISQEEEDRKPKAEVIERGSAFCISSNWVEGTFK